MLFPIVLAVLGAACQRKAGAQVTDDPLGPIGCFEIVDARGLASTAALDLCTGATSVAPGQCYVTGIDRLADLTTLQLVQLCRGATSTAPLACYERLDVDGMLTNDQIIRYCATSCPLGPAPPQSSDPGCFAAALDRTDLSSQMASQLCLSSRSPGPVECFVTGQEVSGLADSSLVQLCAESPSCQYFNALPPGE
jgi:hypothetical protein